LQRLPGVGALAVDRVAAQLDEVGQRGLGFLGLGAAGLIRAGLEGLDLFGQLGQGLVVLGAGVARQEQEECGGERGRVLHGVGPSGGWIRGTTPGGRSRKEAGRFRGAGFPACQSTPTGWKACPTKAGAHFSGLGWSFVDCLSASFASRITAAYARNTLR